MRFSNIIIEMMYHVSLMVYFPMEIRRKYYVQSITYLNQMISVSCATAVEREKKREEEGLKTDLRPLTG